jgi:hypothetical protein
MSMDRFTEMAEREGLQLLGGDELDAAATWASFPPRIAHPGKRLVLELAGGRTRVPKGALRVARYAARQLPQSIPKHAPTFRNAAGAFDYSPAPANICQWYVNFADPYLFFAYGAAAFAQDEIQVAEHPLLGSLREALAAEHVAGVPPLTVDEGRPTPILVRGVERWCSIDLDPDLAMPYGIYGRRFHSAKPEVLQQAAQPLDAGHFTNVIAMAAPRGTGRYSREQIELILETAWVGLSAARIEGDPGYGVIVHTGHWGTGAFGGNRLLMAILQIVAARLARVDGLVYHSLDADGIGTCEEAVRIVSRRLAGSDSLGDLIERVTDLGLYWGTSDGN